MSEKIASTELLRQISDDIHTIRLLMTRLTRESFLKDLRAVASSPERRQMWKLADGTRSTEEIANQIQVSKRAVQYFLQDAQERQLMSFVKRGLPKRPDYFDEIPADWKLHKPSISPMLNQAAILEKV